jgi:hypothetical protein
MAHFRRRQKRASDNEAARWPQVDGGARTTNIAGRRLDFWVTESTWPRRSYGLLQATTTTRSVRKPKVHRGARRMKVAGRWVVCWVAESTGRCGVMATAGTEERVVVGHEGDGGCVVLAESSNCRKRQRR